MVKKNGVKDILHAMKLFQENAQLIYRCLCALIALGCKSNLEIFLTIAKLRRSIVADGALDSIQLVKRIFSSNVQLQGVINEALVLFAAKTK